MALKRGMYQERKGKESEDIDSAGEAVEDSGPFEESAGDTIKNHVKPKIKVKSIGPIYQPWCITISYLTMARLLIPKRWEKVELEKDEETQWKWEEC